MHETRFLENSFHKRRDPFFRSIHVSDVSPRNVPSARVVEGGEHVLHMFGDHPQHVTVRYGTVQIVANKRL